MHGIYYTGYNMIKRDFAKAVKWFREAAKDGNTDAQYNLAYDYQHDLGVERDFDKAIFWNEKAAVKGHRLSQLNLADIYARYEQQQYDKAIRWYKEAANQGLFDAYRRLGDFYLFGLGCEENEVQAFEYYHGLREPIVVQNASKVRINVQ